MFRSLKFTFLAALILVGSAALLAQVLCQVGNLEDPIGLPVVNVFEGAATYAYLIHPIDQCECPDGFIQLQDAFMWLEFEPMMVPVNFTVRAGIRSAFYNAALNQWEPDLLLYDGAEMMIQVMNPGPFPLAVPAVAAPWIGINEYVFLTLEFENPFQANLLCDGNDQPGIVYVSPDGLNWVDMFGPDKTSGGKPIIWGDVVCGPNDGSSSPLPPAGPRFERPYPNPFNPGTQISLIIDKPGQVKISLHDSRGRLIKTLAEEYRDQGSYTYKWDGTDGRGQRSPAGLYFFRAETAGGVTTRKAALIK